MKTKLRSVLAFVLIIIMLAALPAAAAQRLADFDTAKTPIMKGTPKIDGEKDEMYKYSMEFDRPYLYHYSEEGGNLEPGSFTEEQFGVTMKATGSALWDENNFYIFLEVTGDKLYASGDDTLAYWQQGSGVIVMFYPGDSGGDKEMYYKLRIANGAAAYNATAHNTGDDFSSDAVYAYKETANGWNLEIQIKLAKPIKQGDGFQFALQVCSVSAAKNMGFAHVNENFAQITFPFTLGGAVVIPAPEPEPVPDVPEVQAEVVAVAVETPVVVAVPLPATVPQTGDGLSMIALIAMICAAGAGIITVRRVSRR